MVDTSLAAQRTTKATVRDAIELNKLAQRARESKDLSVTVPRNVVTLSKAILLSWGDAAFANAEDEKSMHGFCFGLAEEM